ncbi:hypothetical protein [Nocardiopsis suaedae]|uniref:Uncharacterized protein n=1 Tax=Nocardiopsis suaedae TaxID=3018444 RepID=A0ABT4TTJ3_9ACTN|nr:hypothetical protein [Nocardiopsis suaedae]MDA2808015.1 hypothetical protein [Nocardiopsis suaedae]
MATEMAVSSELPEAKQELADALDELHRATGRISYRRIEKLTASDQDLLDVSHEAARTTIKLLRMPGWETLKSVVSVLADNCHPPRDRAQETVRLLRLWRVINEGETGAYLSAEEFIRTEGWGGDDGKWTPEMVTGIIVNPFNAVEIDRSLAVPHDPMISEDTWVEVAKRTIDEMGVDFFLRVLLRSLKGDYVGATEGAPYGYQDPQHEVQEALEIMNYCNSQILHRLRSEPNLLARSFHTFHSDDTIAPEEKAEVLRAESDQSLLREALSVTPETWHEVSEEAHFLVSHYLIKGGKTVGRPSLPPEQRFQITWRVP